jgi:hypothetical protein
MRALDFTGQRVGRLLVIERAPNRGRHTCWRCLCDCGNEAIVGTLQLRTEATRSCGCLRRETTATIKRSHGCTKTPEYESLFRAIARCHNPKDPAWKNYGGRGITVCDRWRGKDGFVNFLADVGPRPSPEHSLDRIDNNRGYEPGNVRWATRSEQARNKRNNKVFMVQGKRVHVGDCVQRSGLHHRTFYELLTKGWTAEEIVLHREILAAHRQSHSIS